MNLEYPEEVNSSKYFSLIISRTLNSLVANLLGRGTGTFLKKKIFHQGGSRYCDYFLTWYVIPNMI